MEFLILIVVLLLAGIFWRLGEIARKITSTSEPIDELADRTVEKIKEKLEEVRWELGEIKESIDLGFGRIEDSVEHFRKSSGALDDLEHEAELLEISG